MHFNNYQRLTFSVNWLGIEEAREGAFPIKHLNFIALGNWKCSISYPLYIYIIILHITSHIYSIYTYYLRIRNRTPHKKMCSHIKKNCNSKNFNFPSKLPIIKTHFLEVIILIICIKKLNTIYKLWSVFIFR